MLYKILLYSVRTQNKSATDIPIFPPFWNTLPYPSPSHNLGCAFFMGFHLAAALNQMAPIKILQLCLLIFLSTTFYLHYITVTLDWGWNLSPFQVCTVIGQPMTILFFNYNRQVICISQCQRSLIHCCLFF